MNQSGQYTGEHLNPRSACYNRQDGRFERQGSFDCSLTGTSSSGTVTTVGSESIEGHLLRQFPLLLPEHAIEPGCKSTNVASLVEGTRLLREIRGKYRCTLSKVQISNVIKWLVYNLNVTKPDDLCFVKKIDDLSKQIAFSEPIYRRGVQFFIRIAKDEASRNQLIEDYFKISRPGAALPSSMDSNLYLDAPPPELKYPSNRRSYEQAFPENSHCNAERSAGLVPNLNYAPPASDPFWSMKMPAASHGMDPLMQSVAPVEPWLGVSSPVNPSLLQVPPNSSMQPLTDLSWQLNGNAALFGSVEWTGCLDEQLTSQSWDLSIEQAFPANQNHVSAQTSVLDCSTQPRPPPTETAFQLNRSTDSFYFDGGTGEISLQGNPMESVMALNGSRDVSPSESPLHFSLRYDSFATTEGPVNLVSSSRPSNQFQPIYVSPQESESLSRSSSSSLDSSHLVTEALSTEESFCSTMTLTSLIQARRDQFNELCREHSTYDLSQHPEILDYDTVLTWVDNSPMCIERDNPWMTIGFSDLLERMYQMVVALLLVKNRGDGFQGPYPSIPPSNGGGGSPEPPPHGGFGSSWSPPSDENGSSRSQPPDGSSNPSSTNQGGNVSHSLGKTPDLSSHGGNSPRNNSSHDIIDCRNKNLASWDESESCSDDFDSSDDEDDDSDFEGGGGPCASRLKGSHWDMEGKTISIRTFELECSSHEEFAKNFFERPKFDECFDERSLNDGDNRISHLVTNLIEETAQDEVEGNTVEKFTKRDVLFDRGGLTNRHPGVTKLDVSLGRGGLTNRHPVNTEFHSWFAQRCDTLGNQIIKLGMPEKFVHVVGRGSRNYGNPFILQMLHQFVQALRDVLGLCQSSRRTSVPDEKSMSTVQWLNKEVEHKKVNDNVLIEHYVGTLDDSSWKDGDKRPSRCYTTPSSSKNEQIHVLGDVFARMLQGHVEHDNQVQTILLTGLEHDETPSSMPPSSICLLPTTRSAILNNKAKIQQSFLRYDMEDVNASKGISSQTISLGGECIYEKITCIEESDKIVKHYITGHQARDDVAIFFDDSSRIQENAIEIPEEEVDLANSSATIEILEEADIGLKEKEDIASQRLIHSSDNNSTTGKSAPPSSFRLQTAPRMVTDKQRKHNKVDRIIQDYGNSFQIPYLNRIVKDRPRYQHSNNKGKRQLILGVIDWLRQSGGQFVQKDPNNAGEWIPVTDEQRMYKRVRQAFTDMICLLRNQGVEEVENEKAMDTEDDMVVERGEDAVNRSVDSFQVLHLSTSPPASVDFDSTSKNSDTSDETSTAFASTPSTPTSNDTTPTNARYAWEILFQKNLDHLIGGREVRNLPWHAICLGMTDKDPLLAVAIMRRLRGSRVNLETKKKEEGAKKYLLDTNVYDPLIQELQAYQQQNHCLEAAPGNVNELLFVKAFCNRKWRKVYSNYRPSDASVYRNGDIYFEAIEFKDAKARDALVMKYLNGKQYSSVSNNADTSPASEPSPQAPTQRIP